jgi:hypothetical protein
MSALRMAVAARAQLAPLIFFYQPGDRAREMVQRVTREKSQNRRRGQ